MNYTFHDYEFEIIYNPDDLIISCYYHDKLWQDVFTIQEIIKDNSFFNSIDIIKKVIDNSFEVKENFYVTVWLNNKILNLQFIFINEIKKEKIVFELIPIRKDVSSNKEIIDLKRKLKKNNKKIENLQNKIEEMSYLFDNFYINSNFNGKIIPYNFDGVLRFRVSVLSSSKKPNYIDNCKKIFINYGIDIIDDDLSYLKNIKFLIFENVHIDIKTLNSINENIKVVIIECNFYNEDDTFVKNIKNLDLYTGQPIKTFDNKKYIKFDENININLFLEKDSDNCKKNLDGDDKIIDKKNLIDNNFTIKNTNLKKYWCGNNIINYSKIYW
jgi:hypothetical protein